MWLIIIIITIFCTLLIALVLPKIKKSELTVLKKYVSPISGNIVICQTPDGEKRMMMSYYTQGISTNLDSIKQSYWYKAAEIAVNHVKNTQNPEIMTVGLGANTVPNLIANLNPKIHQTLIEIDPAVILACHEYFNLHTLPNHTLIESDIYKLLDKTEYQATQDVILLDILTSKAKQILSKNEPELINKVSKWLKPNGLMLFNRPAHAPQIKKDTEKFIEYLKNTFGNAAAEYVKDPRGFENAVIQVKVNAQPDIT
jgi:spermidine synthase